MKINKRLFQGFEKINTAQQHKIVGAGTTSGYTENNGTDCGDQTGSGGTGSTGTDNDSVRTSSEFDTPPTVF